MHYEKCLNHFVLTVMYILSITYSTVPLVLQSQEHLKSRSLKIHEKLKGALLLC